MRSVAATTTTTTTQAERRRISSWPWLLLLALGLGLLLSLSETTARFINPLEDESASDLNYDALFARSRPSHLTESFSKRDYTPIDPASSASLLAVIPTLADPAASIDFRSKSSFLSTILIPRVPGTANNTLVQNTLAEIFERELGPKPASPHGPARSGWTLDRHTFEADTPEGRKKFTNLIATKDHEAPRKLMLAAHFDSKFFPRPNEGFVGATDSAAPCAILVDTVRAIDSLLDRRAERRKGVEGASVAGETTLQVVFFDGEEAFRTWSRTDSIYGARALASNWSELVIPSAARPKRRRSEGDEEKEEGEGQEMEMEARRYTPTSSTPVKPVDTIEHMVLLDLLGAPNPSIPNYFDHTSWLYDRLVSAERTLRDAGLLKWDKGEEGKTFFAGRKAWSGIEDDHLPFAARGVPIFHLIPSPFPAVWHKLSDDASALDYPTMYAWSMLMRLFTIEYLGLAPYLSRSSSPSPSTRGES
ncbi:unnamed protein product [Tilletia controversa]|nr:unnamed protein product [Tilletia controversa]CAD6935323.1 unnamed protein product [Tilletia controversa]CAD6974163.1 unnamed protein product [Tilletia controversa]